MSDRSNVIIAVVFAVLLPSGWAPSFAQGKPAQSKAETELSTVISNGDMLDVAVFESPDLSTKARVGENGEALLPVAGVVHLQGLTVVNASTVIRNRLMEQRYVKDPKVTVSIAEYATRGVSVLGEVKKPGIYTTMGSHRLNEYISLSEGLTPQAGTRVSITHRAAPDQTVSVTISNTGKPTSGSNPLIEAGDTIVVPKAGEIYIVGDVVRPGQYLMNHDEQLTIMQALALAQGANRTAMLSHAVIVRKTESGRKQIPVNVQAVMSMKSTDITLVDNDILFIPLSKMKAAVNRSLEAIVQTAVGAASYRAF